ncbi:hypothetical protein [Staphylococcus xylosus]|nr:hypothetical protein [Staphylococcus xylosus]
MTAVVLSFVNITGELATITKYLFWGRSLGMCLAIIINPYL